MIPAFLLQEARALTRDVYALSDIPNNGGVVGFWGGEREDLPNNVPPSATALRGRRHLFSFDVELLESLGAPHQGPVAVFEYELANGYTQLKVDQSGTPSARDVRCDGTPLYAVKETCPPPFDAVCLLGSREVEDWLLTFGLSRHDYWKLSEPVVDEFEQQFMESYPLYWNRTDIALVVNPWSIIWPDDDAYALPPLRCAALTLRDPEPWYELWYSERCHSYSVKERIT